ncbi:flippase [Candidatus Uhrbacteria bacterium]|nr:flippase [Candidatus Uhrbacteria bacterium]
MATTGRTIMAQTGIQVLGKIASIGFGVGAIAIITRALGREGFGWYATVMAYLQLFGIAVDLGLNVLAPSELGRLKNGERKNGELENNFSPSISEGEREGVDAHASRLTPHALLSNIFTIRLIAAVVVFLAASAVAFFIPAYSPAVRIGIALATFSFLGIVLQQILLAPFQVAGRMLWPTIAEVVGRAVLMVGVALAAWQQWGLLAMVWATVVGNITMFVMTFLAARRVILIRLAFDFSVWRSILIRAWPIGLSIIFNLVYLRADQVLLSLLQPADHVGIYAAPYRLLDVLTQFPHMVMGLVLPMLAAAWAAGDRPRFHDRLQRTLDGLALLGFPIAAGAIVLGTPIMTLVAGAQFAVSGPVLGVLAVALVGIFLGQPFGYGVVAVGQQRRMLWGYAIVAVVTLIGYLIAIPIWSYWGAAWLTVASEIAIATITFRVVRRASGFRIALRIPASALLASIVMGLALASLQIPIIPRIALGAIIYGLLIFVLPSTRRIVASGFSPSE